jgi:septal ring factor EnvC (AmiA/AmiB activator)
MSSASVLPRFGKYFLLAGSLGLLCVSPLQAQKEEDSGVPAESVLDEEALIKRIQELEAILKRVKAENASLRKQLGAAIATGDIPAAEADEAAEKKPAKIQPAKILPEGTRWVTSTGKRHNAKCRYYGKGEGHTAKPGEGAACKVCGG